MDDNIFRGLITALITPFKNNKIDLDALERILNIQIQAKVDAVILAGTTGEGTSLNTDEYCELINNALEITSNRIPIIASCSSSNTQFIIDLLSRFNNTALDGVMCSVPPYVKPTQNGIFEHFKAIHDNITMPMMLYSPLSRTSVDINNDTLCRLMKLPRILALKDSTGDVTRPLKLYDQAKKAQFNLLSGDDILSIAYRSHGGCGCVSVASNIAPNLCKQVQSHCDNDQFNLALSINQKLAPLYEALFLESNPIVIKYAMHFAGLCENELRLPLTVVNYHTKQRIDPIIRDLKTEYTNM
ncbi:MAG: 4-hydroxy-tetrahydrodipicolinate synthase [Rickettsiaceae bacterium]